uniref:Uncharacterized protein n=1 Tax=Oryza punctata TaxID=4537 RepID=A0A0E0LRI1_ORYPU
MLGWRLAFGSSGHFRAGLAQARPNGRAVPCRPACLNLRPRHGPTTGRASPAHFRVMLDRAFLVLGHRALGRPEKARPKSQLYNIWCPCSLSFMSDEHRTESREAKRTRVVDTAATGRRSWSAGPADRRRSIAVGRDDGERDTHSLALSEAASNVRMEYTVSSS